MLALQIRHIALCVIEENVIHDEAILEAQVYGCAMFCRKGTHNEPLAVLYSVTIGEGIDPQWRHLGCDSFVLHPPIR